MRKLRDNIFFEGNELQHAGNTLHEFVIVTLSKAEEEGTCCPTTQINNQDVSLDGSLARLRPILDRDDKLQSRPDLSHRAYFNIDEAGIESDLANHILREVGGDARTFLWPRDPQHPRRCQRLRSST